MAVAAPGWLLAGYIAMHFSNRFLSGFVHPPGDAQVDFGEAIAIIGGVRQKIHFFCMDIPQSDACFVKAYPRETTEAFLDARPIEGSFSDSRSLIAVSTRSPRSLFCETGSDLRTFG